MENLFGSGIEEKPRIKKKGGWGIEREIDMCMYEQRMMFEEEWYYVPGGQFIAFRQFNKRHVAIQVARSARSVVGVAWTLALRAVVPGFETYPAIASRLAF